MVHGVVHLLPAEIVGLQNHGIVVLWASRWFTQTARDQVDGHPLQDGRIQSAASRSTAAACAAATASRRPHAVCHKLRDSVVPPGRVGRSPGLLQLPAALRTRSQELLRELPDGQPCRALLVRAQRKSGQGSQRRGLPRSGGAHEAQLRTPGPMHALPQRAAEGVPCSGATRRGKVPRSAARGTVARQEPVVLPLSRRLAATSEGLAEVYRGARPGRARRCSLGEAAGSAAARIHGWPNVLLNRDRSPDAQFGGARPR
mmetsp:Transcript_121581/g.355312  ORF Transcript_121581/g.355312 Transcript_121581/m.355312 type:complete len:258 (-) Transcript_121581:730-1503(-)